MTQCEPCRRIAVRAMLALLLCNAAAAADVKPLVLDLGKGAGMKLVRIPAGEFLMGSPATEKFRENHEGPRRKVTISRALDMGACEVTRGQFAAFVAEAGYQTQAERAGWTYAWDGKKWDKVKGATWRKVGFDQTDDHPVACVGWEDATAFCTWLGAKSRRTVRLPTEAEWEYACRAGTTTAWAWGDRRDDGKGWCNAADLTAKKAHKSWRAFGFEDGFLFTAPVGRYKANAWGLHDMHGNVAEWCLDRYAKSHARLPAVDPRGPEAGTKRVVRGGSWLSSPHRVRSAFRAAAEPMGFFCDFILGFRVVAEIPAGAAPASRPSRESDPGKPASAR